MIGWIIALGAVIAVLVFFLVISVRRNLELDDKMEELSDQVAESLDILDDCYQRIAAVSEMPVASDDPIIQQLVSDIRYAKHAVLLVANKIVAFDQEEPTEPEGG